jgi:UTP--glucose-1-phosphate uridylyltransferase
MGAAIGVFDGAAAIRVPRTRFAPVKTTNQLLVVRSDAYDLTDDWTVRAATDPVPVVSLDSSHYKLLNDFEAHFTSGPPSLRECRRLSVEGDVTFGRDVTVKGSVSVSGPRSIPDGSVLEG